MFIPIQRWVVMFPWKEIGIVIVVLGAIYWFRKRFEVKKVDK